MLTMRWLLSDCAFAKVVMSTIGRFAKDASATLAHGPWDTNRGCRRAPNSEAGLLERPAD